MGYNNPKEVLKRASELRESHAPVRAEIACRTALGFAYANGRQWNRVERSGFSGDIDQYPLVEDWDPQSPEIRVVDNRIGPLLRRMIASTRPTRIEASVRPPKHMRGLKHENIAQISQNVLNGLDGSCAFTRAAASTSLLRWFGGSWLLIVETTRKTRQVSADVALNPDGTPVEVQGQWVRWTHAPLSDLIWDPANTSPNLADHSVLMLERPMTLKDFERTYGPIEKFGIDRERVQAMSDIAPHYVAAANVPGCGLWDAYAMRSKEKAVRIIQLLESSDDDPNLWPTCYTILDTSPGFGSSETIVGNVLNMDNPVSSFGHHGRNIFKLDGFVTGDSVWSWGVPNVLMAHNDMINIMRSIEFQQLTSSVFGRWLVDKGTTNRDEFVNQLSEGIGGVLVYDSRSGNSPAPTFMTPPAMNVEFVSLIADLSLGMDAQVHISQAEKGAMKTHVPEATQQAILHESKIVTDNIIQDDKAAYAEALKVTLGTVRKAMDQPNQMLARLVNDHGFNESDLMLFQEVDPARIALDVSVREESIISRSVVERIAQLNGSLQTGLIGAEEHIVAMALDVERPITAGQEYEINYINGILVDILNGQPWPGQPSLNPGMFELLAKRAIHQLDRRKPGAMQQIAMLEQAIQIQRQLALEQMQQMGGMEGGQGQGSETGQETGSEFVPPAQGAPESINPVDAPVGAAGGLPLGLPASVA